MENKRKRVLLVTPELAYTGALQSFRRIAIVLQKNHYVIDIWSYLDGPYKEEFEKVGLRVRIVPENSIDENFINQEVTGYNLIIANTVVTYKVADIAQHIVPVVWYIREAQNLPEFFWKKEREIALRRARKVYSVSEYAQDFIAKNYNSNTHVVHNYVDDVFESAKDSLLPKNKEDKIRFLALGTIEKRKGYDVLLQGFLSLPVQIRQRCELHFAGRLWNGAKDFYPQILKIAEENDDIIYHGELRDRSAIHGLIRDSDVVVVPSRDESCSLVALEAAMMGRPLILSENIGAKYVVDEGSGWVIKTADIESMKNAYITVVQNVDKLPSMGQHARTNYLNTSTYEIYEKNILEMVRNNIALHPYLYRIQANDFKLFSFDIFDTLITRKTQQARGVFLLIQNKLLTDPQYSNIPKLIRLNFEKIRTDIEKFMYRKVCTQDVQDITFYEIYELMAQDYGLSNAQKQSLMELEIRTEKDMVLPICSNIDLVKFLLRQEKRVVLITDMYYDEATIKSFLREVDIVFDNVPIYVSSQYRYKKNNGELYKIIAQKEKISYSDWIHFGNDWNGDFQQAYKLGIKSNYFVTPNLFPYEKQLLAQHSNNFRVQVLIGVSQYCRERSVHTKFEEFGISIGGIVLMPYLWWVIENAKSRNIRDLYFISRDGYILKLIADKIISYLRISISTHYIYGSRVAWKDPIYHHDTNAIHLIQEYLKQEIDIDRRFAFVEFAGTGNTLESLSQLLPSSPNFVGCYYLYHSSNPKTQEVAKFSFLRFSGNFDTCLELLVRAPSGQTLGYTWNEGRVVPIVDDVEGRAISEYRYQEYIDGVLEYVTTFLKYSANILDSVMDLTAFYFYSSYISSPRIDMELADFLGGIPFLLDGSLNGNVAVYAPKLSDSDVELIYHKGLKQSYKGYRLLWSELRSSPEIRERIKKSSTELSGTSFTQKLQKAQRDYANAREELIAIRKSKSYRIGRFITFIPRKIRGGIRCYKENGMQYTLNRAKAKFRRLVRR